MKRLFSLIVCSLFLNACVHHVPPPPPPPPPTPVSVTIAWDYPDLVISNFNVYVNGKLVAAIMGSGRQAQTQVLPGSYQFCVEAVALDGAVSPMACITAPINQVTTVGIPPIQPFPVPSFTRDQVLNVHVTFQGLTVNTQQYGTLPWFEGALAWLSPTDRQVVYATKHVAGDTHCLLAVPSGVPLYAEPNQPYSPDRFPALDWTNHSAGPMLPIFRSVVEEILRQNLVPVIFLQEDQPTSTATIPLVIQALQQAPDITSSVMILPGWDGVFYGWSILQIRNWAMVGRMLCPNCNLGIEFNTGHIPLGNGASDYAPGGPMNGFDALFVEFNDYNVRDDNSWQVLARLLGPAYHRPADQPAYDDPRPPYYLANPTSRGPWGVVCFEHSAFEWVRGTNTIQQVNAKKQYLVSLGCPNAS